jgi:N-acetylmuramic acid 6-phosphate etherase
MNQKITQACRPKKNQNFFRRSNFFGPNNYNNNIVNNNAQKATEHFLNNEKEFHLGFLPSESANPLTAHLDRNFADSTVKGVKTLFTVDCTLVSLFENVLDDVRFAVMRESMRQALENDRRIVFSGCGATGRLSILLEAAWRDYSPERYKNAVGSIMTGGDFALVKSVEFFEDYQQFGRRQVEEMNLGSGDVLIGITATGETASIIGTVMAAAERGTTVFLLTCVPKEIPMNRLERCRIAYNHPNVTVLDMPCGGMAVAGSTRMQSTTLEMLVAAAALEQAAWGGITDYAESFAKLLETLAGEANLQTIAGYLDFETETYRNHGLITYFSNEFLLDILTDTTERSPTFMIPPFRRSDNFTSPVSWAFVKNPDYSTPEAWKRCFRRRPRCLEWTQSDYEAMDAGTLTKKGLPRISEADLRKIMIGNEDAPERTNAKNIPVGVNNQQVSFGDFKINIEAKATPLRLFEHVSIKLILNIISTGTMVKLGRVCGNQMTWLDVSNKKLIDRGIRIIAEQCHLSYSNACLQLFTTIEELKNYPSESEKPSPVQFTINKLKDQ